MEVLNNANAARPPARPPRAVKQTIGERRDDFIGMISKEVSAEAAATTEAAAAAVLAAKASNATNGLATSTFLVCARMRPAFESELAEGGESFECVLKTAAAKEAVEEVTVLLPKLSLRGDPKLEKSKFTLDHAFGQAASNDEVFAALGRPLVAKAFAGEVGVIFAYGQTGSGKTFTMSAMMDRVVAELFPSDGAPDAATARAARFSYLEILGSAVHDCLAAPAAAKNGASGASDVQIGEALDGRVLTRNLSAHDVRSAAELERLLGVAKSRRATAPTERNATSSRSQGGGLTRPPPQRPHQPARPFQRLGGWGGGPHPEAQPRPLSRPGRRQAACLSAQGEHLPRLDRQARRGPPEHRPARLRH